MSLSNEDILKQSQSTYKQWANQWREYAKANSVYEMKSFEKLKYTGIGRAALAVANGYSLEENIEIIRENQHHVDIFCVDKSLGHLLRHGIKPKFVIVCDANIPTEKYLDPYMDQLSDITLISNVCASPKWAAAPWKDRYFFVNKDVLGSEKEFSKISGCPNAIAAATNVSNALIVALTQCDNENHHNYFGYDKILLIGYDYCWTNKGYYAFDKDGGGKTHYMRGVHAYNQARETIYTSTNLLFSAKWIEKYLSTFRLPVIQCSKNSLIVGHKLCPDLAGQMQYNCKPEHSTEVISLLDYKKKLLGELSQIDSRVFEICREHQKALIRTI